MRAEGDQGPHGSQPRQACRAAHRRAGGSPPGGQGGQAAFSRSFTVRQDAPQRDRAHEVLRLPRGVLRHRPRDRPRQPSRHSRAERRRQDHPVARAFRHRAARRGRGRARPRPPTGLLRPGARDVGPLPHRVRERAAQGSAHRERRGAPADPRVVPVRW